MKGALYSLSERVGLLPLIFKETDGGFTPRPQIFRFLRGTF